MRFILFFLLTTQTLFGQINNRSAIPRYPPIDSLIKGDWHLTQVDIVDGYTVLSDTNIFTSHEISNKKITFTADSIYSPRDSTLRFYITQQHFPYKISYDSLARVYNLRLFAGKKRKLHEVESYEIVKCSMDELIIKSYQYLHDGLDFASFSIVYTYRKDGMFDLLNQISGEWFYCSNQGNAFLTENDTVTYEFTRTPGDSVCVQSVYHIDLAFKRVSYENLMKFEFYDEYFGVIGQTTFNFDTINNLIYFLTKDETFVYHYKIVAPEKLVLSLDKERTLQINASETK